MLKIQEVVNFVNDKLNELGTESGYSFDIHAEVGETQNNGKINGILYTNQASTTPIPDYVENNYSFVCELLVPSARANYHFEQIQSLVEGLVDVYDSTEIEFENGDGIVNITPSKPENFNVGYNTGENVPLYFSITILYTEASVTSADVHWLLNGVEIPYINEDIIVDKEGNTNKIYGKKASQTFLTGQTKYFRFRFPYKVGTLCNTLQSDLLEGNFDKQYTLTYYDGQNYILNSETNPPFTTKVSIYKSGNANGQRSKSKVFDITFAEVDDGSDETTYKLALIDNDFDNQTENTRWFDAQLEYSDGVLVGVTKSAQQVQQEYYEGKVNQTSPILTGTRYEQIKAPNLNSLDITSQIYPNNAGYDLFDLANKNYAIIKVEKGQPTLPNGDPNLTYTKKYFYYYVTNCQIGQNNQVLYDLRLDTLQTYLFDDNIEFSDCYIERSNLNRWVWSRREANIEYFKFNLGENSLFYEKENQPNISKRLVNREQLGLKQIGLLNDATFMTWINKYVAGWAYIFLDPTHSFQLYSGLSTSHAFSTKLPQMSIYQNDDTDAEALSTHLVCVCYPIYKDGGKIKMKSSQSTATNEYIYDFDEWGYKYFLEQNNDNAFVTGIKISIVPPFYNYKNSNATLSYTINSDTLTLNCDGGSLDGYQLNYGALIGINADDNVYTSTSGGVTTYTRNGLLLLQIQNSKNIYHVETNKDFEFPKYKITNGLSQDRVKLNPKLLTQEFSSLKITNQDADGFEYDYAKLGTGEFDIAYSEPLTPDISRSYIRLNAATGLYTLGTTQNFTGTVSTNDNSLIRITSAYQQMLAEQKNFFQQNSVNRDINLATGLTQSALGMAGSFASGNALGGIASGLGMVQVGVNHIKSLINENFAVDNMKNKPASIQNAKGNVFLNAMATPLGVYMEEYDVLPSEKIIVNDHMNKYGFTTNIVGNLFNHIGFSRVTLGNNAGVFMSRTLNKRHYFNYIKASVENISGVPMSNVARADMRQRFNNGIRFWYKTEYSDYKIDYSHENYEDWVANYQTVPLP